MRKAIRSVVAGLAVAALGLGVGASAPGVSAGEGADVEARAISRVRFHEAMVALWEDHVAWTRSYIVAFAADQPDADEVAARLLRNQEEIGDAIRPFYGDAAGDRLTSLLQEHIATAVDVLAAAKAGDAGGLERSLRAWYANAREIADLLHSANPTHWARKDLRSMMRMHLDLTLQEASDRLAGDFAADIADYDAVAAEIVDMAHMLARGIVLQFPERFA